ncbi:phage tail protein [Stutzerimonas stutzeri]|uniref:phage tail protein n=1 Tax=Stutzerimonas stutzeri TaxID=316 RepID=UPI000D206155|nr:phage tail protein [Stutzerimonas stutzeri]AVX11495.1 phage tail protein [Stutzerimonas stutzeri]
MKFFFCAETLGLYPGQPYGDAVGKLCVEISEEHYRAVAGHPLVADENGAPVLASSYPAIITSEDLARQIDSAADTARAAVVGDATRTIEYERSAAEARSFADAGYPADAVPRTVAAWAINGRTAQQAADSILAEAAAYTEALYVIRETRLAAKEQIRTLMAAGEVEQAQQLAEQTVAAIEAAVAGVGNAAA